MSRGPGKVQIAILDLLERDRTGRPTAEILRWSMAKHAEKLPGDRSPDLTGAWNTSFHRAIKGLKKNRLIRIVHRPLENLQECVEHYPGKTLKGNLHDLRVELLPVLFDWSKESGGLSPKYGVAENEEHHLRLLRNDRTSLKLLETAWIKLEARLRPIYGKALSDQHDELLGLICRGREMFRERYGFPITDIHATTSLTGAINAVCKTSLLPTNLIKDLQMFLEKFIPTSTASKLKLHSIVHELADVPRSGPCRLRDSALKYLHENRKDFIEHMEGFSPRPPSQALLNWQKQDEYNYPADLWKLVDHSVFKKFNFLELI